MKKNSSTGSNNSRQEPEPDAQPDDTQPDASIESEPELPVVEPGAINNQSNNNTTDTNVEIGGDTQCLDSVQLLLSVPKQAEVKVVTFTDPEDTDEDLDEGDAIVALETGRVWNMNSPNADITDEIVLGIHNNNNHHHPKSTAKQHQRVNSAFSFFAAGSNPKRKTSRGGAGGGGPGGHHRRRSSFSRLMGNIGNGIGSIMEDVQISARDVSRSWREEMATANDGSFIFLESSLMRGLSILPEDMENLVERIPRRSERRPLLDHRHPTTTFGAATMGTTTDDQTPHDATMTESSSKASKLGPYISLLGAVLAVSSNGTALTLQSKVPPPLKLYWRMVGTTIILAPFAVRLFWTDGLPQLSVGQWATLGLAAACYVVHNLCFITALTYTSIGNAVLFANTQALILLAGKALTGVPIELLEYMGAIVAFTGAILCATDEDRVTVAGVGKDAATGDMLAMVSAVFGVGYLTFAKAVRPATSVVAFMFLVMSVGSCLVLLYLTLLQQPFSFSIEPYHGLFGWMALRYDRLPLELWIVVVCNLVGTMGFVRSMHYFDSIIIAISTLLEPMVASVIATIMHVGVLPGPQGWLGNILVIVGTFAVVYPSAAKGDAAGH